MLHLEPTRIYYVLAAPTRVELGCKCAPLSLHSGMSPSVSSLLPQRHLPCGDVGGGDKNERLAVGGNLHGLLYFSIVLLL